MFPILITGVNHAHDGFVYDVDDQHIVETGHEGHQGVQGAEGGSHQGQVDHGWAVVDDKAAGVSAQGEGHRPDDEHELEILHCHPRVLG